MWGGVGREARCGVNTVVLDAFDYTVYAFDAFDYVSCDVIHNAITRP